MAQQWLQQQGLQTVCVNFHSRFGELDIIMQDGEILVFVEVRYRKSESHGGALASVDFRKQRKLFKAAQYFLLSNKQWANRICRFDVIAMTLGTDNTMHYEWIQNAFYGSAF